MHGAVSRWRVSLLRVGGAVSAAETRWLRLDSEGVSSRLLRRLQVRLGGLQRWRRGTWPAPETLFWRVK